MKRERLRRGMTQLDLAERCAAAGVQVDHSHISRIERGQALPRPGLRVVLATILGLDIEVFDQQHGTAA